MQYYAVIDTNVIVSAMLKWDSIPGSILDLALDIDLRATPELPLFWNGRRHKLTRSGVTYIVQKYAEMAQELSTGMPAKISPHVFRHTKAMHLVQANVNPVYIKDYLGHADVSTTEVYARADNEAKRAVLEKATAHLDLPKASHWEQDTELIDWLSSLG